MAKLLVTWGAFTISFIEWLVCKRLDLALKSTQKLKVTMSLRVSTGRFKRRTEGGSVSTPADGEVTIAKSVAEAATVAGSETIAGMITGVGPVSGTSSATTLGTPAALVRLTIGELVGLTVEVFLVLCFLRFAIVYYSIRRTDPDPSRFCRQRGGDKSNQLIFFLSWKDRLCDIVYQNGRKVRDAWRSMASWSFRFWTKGYTKVTRMAQAPTSPASRRRPVSLLSPTKISNLHLAAVS